MYRTSVKQAQEGCGRRRGGSETTLTKGVQSISIRHMKPNHSWLGAEARGARAAPGYGKKVKGGP